jgi:colanic acid/amylovoran biosynthesis glycosyltransferase
MTSTTPELQQEDQGPAIGYLVSRYPAISHTFILNEVRALRGLGFRISVASINSADRTPDAFTAEEVEEAGQCYYVKRAGIRGAFGALAWALRRRPGATLSGLVFALRLGGADLGKWLLVRCRTRRR